ELTGALEHETFLIRRLDAEMAKRRLIERLHALARHRDADAADREQRHSAEIDVASARYGAGRAYLAVAETRHAKRALERLDALGARAAAERDRDFLPLARRMRCIGRRRIAQIAEPGALG